MLYSLKRVQISNYTTQIVDQILHWNRNPVIHATLLHTRIGFLVATYLPFFENRSFDFEFWNVNADKKMLRNVQFEVHRNFITSWKLVLQYSIFKKVIGLLMFWIYKAVRLNEALKIINSRKACVCPKFHFQPVTNLPQIITIQVLLMQSCMQS